MRRPSLSVLATARKALNAALRARDRGLLKQHYFPFLRIMMSALRRISDAAGKSLQVLNRGVGKDLVSANPEHYIENSRLVWWAFSSCTKKISVLGNDQFLGTSGDRTLFQARCLLHRPRAARPLPFPARYALRVLCASLTSRCRSRGSRSRPAAAWT